MWMTCYGNWLDLVLKELILCMNRGSLLYVAAFLIFILLAMKNLTVLNCLEMKWTPYVSLIPETQLSERKLLQVNIIPNVDTQFENEERISLFDFLPENTVVWMQDYELCKERLIAGRRPAIFFKDGGKTCQRLQWNGRR